MSLDKYFQAYQDYFWQWEAGENLLAIPNGNTIAYQEYVAEVMDLLAIQGLPPFGSLLLAIIATNQESRESIDMIDQRVQSILIQNIDLSHDKNMLFVEAKSFLITLNKLPDKLKTGKNRLLLFQTIFRSSHNHISISKSKILADKIKKRVVQTNCFNKEIITQKALQIDLKPLALLGKKYPTPEAIIETIAAIEEIPDLDIEDNNTQTKPTTDFVDDLLNNPKTFHVGALIKNLWGGLNIPLHYNTPSQQPLGGVSDISSKGDFDKLLISEFANDDIVFLSRLANNEALYINREIPPLKNNLDRIILIDISLHNWGNPKTIAFAIMLALAKHPKNRITCIPYVVGNSYDAVEYNTVFDLIRSMEQVAPCLYPSIGLTHFFENEIVENKEFIFITSRETMKYPEMKSVVNQYRNRINYIAYVDSWGKIELYRMLNNSKKHLQSLTLELYTIWQNNKKGKTIEVVADEGLFSHPYPLLFTPKHSSGKLMKLGTNYYYMDKCLLMKKVLPDKAWKIVYDKLEIVPSAYQVGFNVDGELFLLVCFNNNKQMELHNLSTGEKKSKPYPNLHFSKDSLHFHSGSFYAFDNKRKLIKIDWDLSFANVVNKETIENAMQADIKKDRSEHWNIMHRKSVIYNIKRIGVTNNHDIVINDKHILRIKSNPELEARLEPFRQESVKEHATWNSEKVFQFKNGIKGENYQGMLKLTLKDDRVAYIPLVIDTPLAIAVNNTVAGNPYFYTADKKHSEVAVRIAVDILKSEETWN